MLAVQESIEWELTAEVERLSATVSKQRDVIEKWRPIVLAHLYGSENRRRIGSVRFVDDFEDLLVEADEYPYSTPGLASKLDAKPTRSPYSANTSTSYDADSRGVEWMKVSSPTTPRWESDSPGFGRERGTKPSHGTSNPMACSNSSEKYTCIPGKNCSFQVEDLSSSDHSSSDPAEERGGWSRTTGKMTRSHTDPSFKMPFREILSLFNDKSFDSDRSTSSGPRHDDAGDSPNFRECDEVQAELLSEVQHILQHSPSFTRSAGGLSSSAGTAASSYNNTNRFGRSYSSA